MRERQITHEEFEIEALWRNRILTAATEVGAFLLSNTTRMGEGLIIEPVSKDTAERLIDHFNYLDVSTRYPHVFPINVNMHDAFNYTAAEVRQAHLVVAEIVLEEFMPRAS